MSSFSASDYDIDNYSDSNNGGTFWVIAIAVIVVGAIIANIVAFFYNRSNSNSDLNNNFVKNKTITHDSYSEKLEVESGEDITKNEKSNDMVVALIILFIIALVIFSVTMYKDVEVQLVDNQTNFIDGITNDNMNDYLDDHPDTQDATIYVKDLYEQVYIDEEKYNKYEDVQNDYIEIEYNDSKEEWTWNYYEENDS